MKAATKQARFQVQHCMAAPVMVLTNILSVLLYCHAGPHGERLEELPDRWSGLELDVTRREHHNIGFPCAFLRLAATMSHHHMTTSYSLQRAATMTCNCNWER